MCAKQLEHIQLVFKKAWPVILSETSTLKSWIPPVLNPSLNHYICSEVQIVVLMNYKTID